MWAFLFKVSQLVVPITLSGLVALNVWQVQKIHAHDVSLAEVRQWMNQGPRLTPGDAETLRLKILKEAGDVATVRQDQILYRLDKLNDEVVTVRAIITEHNRTSLVK